MSLVKKKKVQLMFLEHTINMYTIIKYKTKM